MGQESVRMKDVARLANVSTATVSYVLNNTAQVSEATRKRVLKVVEHLNYQRNPIAKTLRTRKSATIGVMVEDMTVFNAPKIVDGINEFTDEMGFHIVLSNLRLNTRLLHDFRRPRYDLRSLSNYQELIADAVNVLLNRQIDGMIYIGEHTHDVTGLIDRGDKPCVYTYCFTQDPSDYSINYDDRGAAFSAVEHLIDSGHRNIAVVTGLPDSFPSAERLKGYYDALAKHRISVRPELIAEGDWEHESGARSLPELLRQPNPPTAIFAMNDLMALGVIDAAREMGHEVPKDISVIGFDNREQSAYSHPRLTTLDLPLREMGARAAETLLELIGGRQPEQHRIWLPCTLLSRNSTRSIGTSDNYRYMQ